MPSFRGNHADSPPSLRPSLPPSMIRPIPHSSHLAIRHRSDGDYAWHPRAPPRPETERTRHGELILGLNLGEIRATAEDTGYVSYHTTGLKNVPQGQRAGRVKIETTLSVTPKLPSNFRTCQDLQRVIGREGAREQARTYFSIISTNFRNKATG